jgi:rod shape-determining protein MreC
VNVFALLKRYRELILVAVLLLVPLGVFFAHAKAPSERSRLDRAVVWLATPVEKAIGWTLGGVMRGWSGYVALRGAHDRAGKLGAQVQALELERQQLLAERAEAERLREPEEVMMETARPVVFE